MPEGRLQLHQFPWSHLNDNSLEISMNDLEVFYEFYGSPLVSVPEGWSIIGVKRYEDLSDIGVRYQAGNVSYRLCRLPHGSTSYKDRESIHNEQHLLLKTDKGVKHLVLKSKGAKAAPKYDNNQRIDNAQSKIMLSWVYLFDSCQKHLIDVNNTSESSNISWDKLQKNINMLKGNESSPRRSLILGIAQSMHKRIHDLSNNARKILSRERSLLPAGRVKELDIACLQWYIRQPGETLAEKAGANSQRLLGVSRYEAYDTLENRVLKDFLERCKTESGKYVKDNKSFVGTKEYKTVNSFGRNSDALLKSSVFQAVTSVSGKIKPNYVLLHDRRYNKVWKLYKKLLRQDHEEDILWDWQANTWSDLTCIFINLALRKLLSDASRFSLEEIINSSFNFYSEQRQGIRLFRGCDAGPYVLKKNKDWENAAVLEVIHCCLLGKYDKLKYLGFIGADLYLCINHIALGKKTVIAVWSIHEASSNNKTDGVIVNSAAEAVGKVNLGISEDVTVKGLVISSTDSEETDFLFSEDDQVCYVRIPQKTGCWNAAVESLSLVLSDYFEKLWS